MRISIPSAQDCKASGLPERWRALLRNIRPSAKRARFQRSRRNQKIYRSVAGPTIFSSLLTKYVPQEKKWLSPEGHSTPGLCAFKWLFSQNTKQINERITEATIIAGTIFFLSNQRFSHALNKPITSPPVPIRASDAKSANFLVSCGITRSSPETMTPTLSFSTLPKTGPNSMRRSIPAIMLTPIQSSTSEASLNLSSVNDDSEKRFNFIRTSSLSRETRYARLPRKTIPFQKKSLRQSIASTAWITDSSQKVGAQKIRFGCMSGLYGSVQRDNELSPCSEISYPHIIPETAQRKSDAASMAIAMVARSRESLFILRSLSNLARPMPIRNKETIARYVNATLGRYASSLPSRRLKEEPKTPRASVPERRSSPVQATNSQTNPELCSEFFIRHSLLLKDSETHERFTDFFIKGGD